MHQTEADLRRALAAYVETHQHTRLRTLRDIERTRELAAALERHAAFASCLADVSEDFAARPPATVLDLDTLRGVKRGAA